MKAAAVKSNKPNESRAAAHSISQKKRDRKGVLGAAGNRHRPAADHLTTVLNGLAGESKFKRLYAPYPGSTTSQSQTTTNITQRYTEIDLDESQTWEEVRNAFIAIRPQLIEQGEIGSEHYVMRYVEGPPESSKLKVSDQGNLAINADTGAQHTVFFIGSGTLKQANKDLTEANSSFLLKPTGVMVVVHNHPVNGAKKELLRVEADPVHDQGMEWAKSLETRCNVYFKNITKAHQGFEEIFSTSKEENDQGEISLERRIQLDRVLGEMTLKAGDAFEIKSFGENSPGFGWNEHYAGIVAVDGADQITLENYNRESEFGEKVIVEATRKLGQNGQQIQDQLSTLRKELSKKWFWQKDAKKRLQTQIEELEALSRKWNNIMTRSTREDVATHHFQIYGPASKGQSFLDMWRGGMEQKQSKFSAAKAIRKD